MATITTKYSVGDVVWCAGTTTERKKHPCPDCSGCRQWKAVSPAGNEYDFACPRCSARYNSDQDLTLDYSAHVPSVRRLTIGSVQFNSAPGSWDSGARYMAHETGIGSGSVYDEARLFASEAEATAASEIMARDNDKNLKWCATLYNKTLEISDYQLENAALRNAKDFRSRAGSLVWNVNDLFDTIEAADDKDAILEAVNDYKEYYWKGDREKVAAGIETGTAKTEGLGPKDESPTAKQAAQ